MKNRGVTEMTDEELLRGFYQESAKNAAAHDPDVWESLRAELLKRMSRGPVRGAREIAERICAWLRHNTLADRVTPSDLVPFIIAQAPQGPACPKCGSVRVSIRYHHYKQGVHAADCMNCGAGCDSTGTMFAQFFAAPAQRPACSACGHVHQLGRITCGHFIREDPHQGEICCECVAAPAGGAAPDEEPFGGAHDELAPEPQGATPEKRSEILKVAATADISSPAAMVAALEKIAMLCTEPSAPAETREPEKLKELIKASVELAIVRHNLTDGDEDFDMNDVTEDVAEAAFGNGTCAEEPIPEVKAFLAAAPPSEVAALRELVAKWREHDGPTDRIIGYRNCADDLEKALGVK